MSEKLIPVTSESELRPGMICVTKPCTACGATHRTMLVRRAEPGPWDHPVHGRVYVAGWEGVPSRPCNDKDGQHCYDWAIPEGRLFRVDDGIDDKADELQRKCDDLAARVKARLKSAQENAR